ncbi:MAG: PhoH family protein [Gemmatimonadetes bacterium]|uniref:PhoH-like protein n=1 Tax=Candidatus Kutchimonas denitrificans TaxID=3056748 RepID=A0AAE4Z8U9_9BACT|nr:PhoH family protein [Gemmatimonadota bacterium]NIR74617.1 PhoH family protein [Candidatus Kutchimonas denitrificans]NIS02807.1 PhoH family protein [Gemmatimonadota bacterium]NIT68968.1 PhoH family protein [Gemmatimonadota bacterium]NIU52273.1 AAA family ATPase [Gemmatimonadota bacterium]
MANRSVNASQIVQHRLPADGADQLILAGVNDANLQELARVCGCRVVLRDDHLVLSGTLGEVERCVPVAQRMIELATMEKPFAATDIQRFADEAAESNGLAPGDLDAAKIILPGTRKIITPKSAGQKLYIETIAENEIVIGIGPAGTGKTYLAVAMAVDALHKKRLRRIVLVRPVVEAGEQLGFLPGTLEEKVDPYLRPLYDALGDMMPPDQMRRLLESRTLEIAPLAYMRGRTLSDAFVILDEAQNTTTAQMKMFLTRLGVNSRAVITGDKTQIDLPKREDSGLLEIERILKGIDGISLVYLTDADVVRHRLVKDIIKAYTRAQNDASSRKE